MKGPLAGSDLLWVRCIMSCQRHGAERANEEKRHRLHHKHQRQLDLRTAVMTEVIDEADRATTPTSAARDVKRFSICGTIGSLHDALRK